MGLARLSRQLGVDLDSARLLVTPRDPNWSVRLGEKGCGSSGSWVFGFRVFGFGFRGVRGAKV